jgi:hypothetical protein
VRPWTSDNRGAKTVFYEAKARLKTQESVLEAIPWAIKRIKRSHTPAKWQKNGILMRVGPVGSSSRPSKF